jgi:hypothetical protein
MNAPNPHFLSGFQLVTHIINLAAPERLTLKLSAGKEHFAIHAGVVHGRRFDHVPPAKVKQLFSRWGVAGRSFRPSNPIRSMHPEV